MAYKIVYTDGTGEGGMVKVCNTSTGTETEEMEYPDSGIGLVELDGMTLVLVTPDCDSDSLEHDTVFALSPCETTVEGDFIEGQEDDDDDSDDEDEDSEESEIEELEADVE